MNVFEFFELCTLDSAKIQPCHWQNYSTQCYTCILYMYDMYANFKTGILGQDLHDCTFIYYM